MGCSFQNWRSISCSLRGSMLCMVLYLDFHCVSHQQLFEAVGARHLAHHSHLRRRHRRLLRFLGLGLGYRGGNSSNRPRPERRGLWEGLRAWVWVCSWNQEVCHGAWERAGRALALAGQLARWAGQEPAQELAQSLQHRPRAARQQPPPLSGSSLPSLSSKHLLPRARPTSPSAVEVYAEADAGASQVHEIAFIIRQLETEVLQRDGASQVYHVILVGVRLHDVPHALLADDLRDDVVAQRAHCLGCIRQAATART